MYFGKKITEILFSVLRDGLFFFFHVTNNSTIVTMAPSPPSSFSFLFSAAWVVRWIFNA